MEAEIEQELEQEEQARVARNTDGRIQPKQIFLEVKQTIL